MARMSEAPRVVVLGDERNRRHRIDAVEAAQRLHRLAPRLLLGDGCDLLAESFESPFDLFDGEQVVRTPRRGNVSARSHARYFADHVGLEPVTSIVSEAQLRRTSLASMGRTR